MTKLSTQGQNYRKDHRSRGWSLRGYERRAIKGKRRIDTAYEVYLGLYQAITGPEDHQKSLPRVVAQLLRSHRDRRVPPRQRRRGFGMAGDSRILLAGHADRPDGHPQGNGKYVSNIGITSVSPFTTYSLKQGIQRRISSPPTRSSRCILTAMWKAIRPETRAAGSGRHARSRTVSTTPGISTALMVLDDRTQARRPERSRSF